MSETVIEKAQRLIDTNCVRIATRTPLFTQADVAGDNGWYDVVIYHTGAYSCTCTWHSCNASSSDMCSHALAVKLTLQKETP